MADKARSNSTLRANPYPEVTDRICRLPLPTCVWHCRGYEPWIPDADIGYGQTRTCRACMNTEQEQSPRPRFHGPAGTPRRTRQSWRSAATGHPFARRTASRNGLVRQAEKKTLPRATAGGCGLVSFAWTSDWRKPIEGAGTGQGTKSPFPFA